MLAPRFLFELVDHKGEKHTFQFVANQLCWHELEEHFNCSMWTWVERWLTAEKLTDTQRLLYHMTESHRDRCGQISFRSFLEMLPDDPVQWQKLRDCLVECMNKTFFAPSLTRTAILMAMKVFAAQQERERDWIGTSDAETPASSESVEQSSGTSSV